MEYTTFKLKTNLIQKTVGDRVLVTFPQGSNLEGWTFWLNRRNMSPSSMNIFDVIIPDTYNYIIKKTKHDGECWIVESEQIINALLLAKYFDVERSEQDLG